MSDSFAQFSLYEKKITALLKVAEETNQTEFIFQKLFEQYSSELKYRSQIFTSLLNPIFIFVIAVLVTFILVAMYLPMFKLGSVIG
jgi:type II secretory pathway component PulF|tara:strand:- start:458 stop:715 length:258 start_codon:yes stop_codon:yes gene_type:complete